MPVYGKDAELDAVLYAARLMAVSARTAPKGRGMDTITTLILTGEDKDRVADEMLKIWETKRFYPFQRDAENIRKAQVLLLIGVKSREPKGLNCGACGFNCDRLHEMEKRLEYDFPGPNCVMYVLDLGIALGSAVKTASMLNVDNRIMYTVGAAAKRLNLMDADIIIGVPLSVSGKNIFFDRRRPVQAK
ncbi:MAG TPA: hypothetical protein ENF62_00295 [Candidatus Bathyarchaeota archaeon]|nr:hypothetical protein [Candidatus Bathyarchaeota archaeon]